MSLKRQYLMLFGARLDLDSIQATDDKFVDRVLLSDSDIHCKIEGGSMSTFLSEFEVQRERLILQLSVLGDLRPGSLVERYRKCGKPNCHCAQPGEPGHGPSWSLTHDVKGKTTTRIIPKAFVSLTREHIAEYQRFMQPLRQPSDISR
jgi:hypothetical protein